MKKFAAILLALALAMSLAVPAFAADYVPYSVTGWWSEPTGTITIDKTYTENYEIHVPVGAVVTYAAVNEGPLYVEGAYYFDGANETKVHWCYDPAAGGMVNHSEAGHRSACAKLSAGTYTFTVTAEMAESFAKFNTITAISEYDRNGASMTAGMFNDMGFELGTDYLVLDAPAAPVTPPAPADDGNPFTDVPAGAYYHDAVLWALEKGITTGTSETTFGPTETCTRGQVATFLWRAKGCPEPVTTVNPFTDVKTNDYFYKAVLWAFENGITNGTSETTFGPGETCTSGQVVTFLWRANGQPAAETADTAYYAKAVAWGNANALLAGTDVPFAPNNLSPRADIVTYLYRDLAK